MDNIHTPIVSKRKLVVSGGSVVVTIPKEWIDANKLKVGSEVIIFGVGDTLKIVPNTEKYQKQIFKAFEV